MVAHTPNTIFDYSRPINNFGQHISSPYFYLSLSIIHINDIKIYPKKVN